MDRLTSPFASQTGKSTRSPLVVRAVMMCIDLGITWTIPSMAFDGDGIMTLVVQYYDIRKWGFGGVNLG